MTQANRFTRREVLATTGALAGVAFAAKAALGQENSQANQKGKKPAVKRHSRPARASANHPKIREIARRPPQTTRFSFGDLKAGDCVMHNLVVTVQSDGKMTWTSTVESHDPPFVGDTWHMQFTGQDINNQALFLTQIFDSDAIRQADKPRPFNGTFFFAPYIYPYVTQIIAEYSC
jgi:hypothetical protein